MTKKKTFSVLSILGYGITIGFIFGILLYPKIEPVLAEFQWHPVPGFYCTENEQDEIATLFKENSIKYKFHSSGQLLIKGKESWIGFNKIILSDRADE